MVAALHSFVGIAATLVGYSKFIYESQLEGMDVLHKIETFLGILIGAITFIGSVVACGKL
jgi:NAD(P) transhydrogenase subunit beta